MITKALIMGYFHRLFIKFFAKLFIRLKRIKHVHYDEEELNKLLINFFPKKLNMPLVNSEGELTILNVEISMPLDQNKLHAQLFCSFVIMVVGKAIYRAHLVVTGTVVPYYIADKKEIRLKNLQISEIRLVNDDFAFIGSATELAMFYVPKPFKLLMGSTVHITLSLLKGVIPNELLSYVTLYSSGSKQKVLDFHTPEIEHLIHKEIEQNSSYYPLDESDIEEKLFADMGKEIVVENGKLVFKFHID